MNMPWDGLAYVQNFIRLDFIFSGTEVPSSWVLAARFAFLVLFGGGLVWVAYRIVWKVLDCVQTLLTGVVHLPKSFFLVLLLVIPLSPDSLGARSVGYMLALFFVLAVVAAVGLVFVLWKYGVDQTLRLVHALKNRSDTTAERHATSSSPPENIVTQPPVEGGLRERMPWPRTG